MEKDGSKSSERAKPEDTLGTEKAEEDKLDCLNSVNGEWERKLSKKVAVLGSELRAWKA